MEASYKDRYKEASYKDRFRKPLLRVLRKTKCSYTVQYTYIRSLGCGVHCVQYTVHMEPGVWRTLCTVYIRSLGCGVHCVHCTVYIYGAWGVAYTVYSIHTETGVWRTTYIPYLFIVS